LEEEVMKIQSEANHEGLVGPAKELRLSPVEIYRPCLRSLLPVTKIGPSKCGLNDKEI
jgi:hypothetical protein